MKKEYKELGSCLKEWRAINRAHRGDSYGGYAELYYDIDEDRFSVEEFASRDGFIRYGESDRTVMVENEMYEWDREAGGEYWNGNTSYKMTVAYIKKFFNEHMDFVLERNGWDEG